MHLLPPAQQGHNGGAVVPRRQRQGGRLWQGRKPGGRLASADFLPTSKKSAPAGQRNEGDNHGIMPDTVIEELKAARFDNAREEGWSRPRGFLVVAEKKRS